MAQHGKRYRELAQKVERGKSYGPEQAVHLVKETSKANFDPTVEVHFRLGIDPKQADQQVRGAAVLPHGTGKTVRVAVFAAGDRAREAREAGADIVGTDDLTKRIEGGWLEFDVAIATPDVMGQVGKLGRVLGPRGLMPNPRSGTVTNDIGKAVREAKGGRVEFRADKTGVLHTVVGKASFGEKELVENLATLVDAIVRAKPAGVKGIYVRGAHLTSTQGPSVKLELTETLALGGTAAA